MLLCPKPNSNVRPRICVRNLGVLNDPQLPDHSSATQSSPWTECNTISIKLRAASNCCTKTILLNLKRLLHALHLQTPPCLYSGFRLTVACTQFICIWVTGAGDDGGDGAEAAAVVPPAAAAATYKTRNTWLVFGLSNYIRRACHKTLESPMNRTKTGGNRPALRLESRKIA